MKIPATDAVQERIATWEVKEMWDLGRNGPVTDIYLMSPAGTHARLHLGHREADFTWVEDKFLEI